MPIFGENIGTAYVRVVASGDGLDESIRKEFADSEPTVREGGSRHGHVYGEEFDKAVREDFEKRQKRTFGEMSDDLSRALRQSMQRIELGRVFFESDEWKKVRAEMAHEGGAAGELYANNLEKEFRDSFDIDALGRRIKDSGPGVRKAQDDILKALHTDALRENEDFDRRLADQQSRLMNLFREFQQELGRFERGEAGVSHTRKSLIADFERLKGLFTSMGPVMGNMGDDFVDLDRRLARITRTGDSARSTFARWGDDIDRFGDRVGRVFGLGSRNNFLNFFGSIVAAGVKLPGLFTSIGEKVAEMAGNFQELRTAEGLMTAVAMTAAQGAVGLAVLAAAVVALSLLIGPLVSLLFALAGILLALAGTVALAAAAVGGVLLGALGPLALGLGVTIAAIVGLKKHAGDLAPQLKQLKGDFLDLAQVAKNAAFARLPQQMDQLHGILKGLDPLVRAVGRGISFMIDELLGAFQSSAFIRFRDTFEKAMPAIMRRLGSITANAFEGLFGLFRALLPLVQRFLGWLDSITGNFARWVNSARGQRAVQDFFDRAAHSAEELGGFIAAAVGLISDLISAGAGAGDSIFGDLTEKIQEFRDFLAEPVALKTAPAKFAHKGMPGDQQGASLNVAPPQQISRLEKFFGWIEKIAKKLGDAAVAASELLASFNDPESQANLERLLETLTFMLGVLTKIQEMTGGLVGALSSIGSAFSSINIFGGKKLDIGQAFGDLGKNFADIFRPIGHVFDNLVLQPIRDGWRDIQDLFHIHIDWGKLFGHLPSGSGFAKMIRLPTGAEIAKMIGHVNVGGMIEGASKAAGKLVGAFTGTASKVFQKVKTNVSAMISGAASAAGKLLAAFAGMSNKVFQKVKTNVSNMISGAASAAGQLVAAFASTSARVLAKVRTNVSGMISGAGEAASRLVDAFRGLAGRIVDAIGTIVPRFSLPHIPGLHTATGGIFDGAQLRVIAEAGPEAVVPLDRPLSQVDPAVRMLSAIAQGKVPQMASGGVVPGKTLNVVQNITTPTTDTHSVAVEAVNYLAAVGGY